MAESEGAIAVELAVVPVELAVEMWPLLAVSVHEAGIFVVLAALLLFLAGRHIRRIV